MTHQRQSAGCFPKIVAESLLLMIAVLHVINRGISKQVTTLCMFVIENGVVCGQVSAPGGTLPECVGGGASYSGRMVGASDAWGVWQWQIFQVSGVRLCRLPSAAS
jgi:hypothetical protein